VAILWSSRRQRDAQPPDRAADRDGDAELAAYNEMLKKSAGATAPLAGRPPSRVTRMVLVDRA
jgi:putative copper resistance protein D